MFSTAFLFGFSASLVFSFVSFVIIYLKFIRIIGNLHLISKISRGRLAINWKIIKERKLEGLVLWIFINCFWPLTMLIQKYLQLMNRYKQHSNTTVKPRNSRQQTFYIQKSVLPCIFCVHLQVFINVVVNVPYSTV